MQAPAVKSGPNLPPGQIAREAHPRFGLPWLAYRFPSETDRLVIEVAGDVARPLVITTELRELPRLEQTSDLHCVTTWTKQSLRWGGISFRDFYEQLVLAQVRPAEDADLVVFFGQDGYRNALPLQDLLAPDVILADSLDGAALNMEHGAPLRLIAPRHYGYKSVKHVKRIEFRRNEKKHHRIPGPGFMSHPRARVALEERGRYLPGWIYRALYRPLIQLTVWAFRSGALRYYRRRQG
jgi:DMSO/TMAO reductase YedYZ molybdopterin-dependent catalytic subunit